MTIKDDLRHLVDELDEDAADKLLEYARWLAAEEAPERLFGGARASTELGLGPVRLAARGLGRPLTDAGLQRRAQLPWLEARGACRLSRLR